MPCLHMVVDKFSKFPIQIDHAYKVERCMYAELVSEMVDQAICSMQTKIHNYGHAVYTHENLYIILW